MLYFLLFRGSFSSQSISAPSDNFFPSLFSIVKHTSTSVERLFFFFLYVCKSFLFVWALKAHIACKGMRFYVWEEEWKGAVLETSLRLVAFLRFSCSATLLLLEQQKGSKTVCPVYGKEARGTAGYSFFCASSLLVPLQTFPGRVEDGKVARDLRGTTRRSLRGRIRERA